MFFITSDVPTASVSLFDALQGRGVTGFTGIYDEKKHNDDRRSGGSGRRVCGLFHRLVQAQDGTDISYQPQPAPARPARRRVAEPDLWHQPAAQADGDPGSAGRWLPDEPQCAAGVAPDLGF